MPSFRTQHLVILLALILVVALVVLFVRPYEPRLDNTDRVMPARLHTLWLTTLYDPILALPGSDPEMIREAVIALKEGEETILGEYTDRDQERIKSSLHPHAFLSSLPDLEHTRRTFNEAPSYWHAIRYHIALTRTLALLEEYSRTLSDTIYDLNIGRGVSVPSGNTSGLFVSQTLAEAYVRAREQRAEVFDRMRCLVQRTRCNVRYPEIGTEPDSSEVFDRGAILQHAAALRSYFGSVPSPRFRSVADAPPESLPLVYIHDASCTTERSAVYLFFWRVSRASSITTFFATPTNEIYFHRTADGMSLFENALADAGISYAYQQMSPYLCFDYTHDAGTVRTAYAVYRALSDATLASTYADDVLQELASYEQMIISDDVIIDTRIIEAYMHEAATLLYRDELQHVLTEADKLRLLSLLTMWRAKSSWLETEIAAAEDMTVTNHYVYQIMDIPLDALLLSRSYYSTLLLSGNETLYRTPLIFTEERTRMLPAGSDLVPYQGVLERTIPLSELSEFLSREGQKSTRVYTIE